MEKERVLQLALEAMEQQRLTVEEEIRELTAQLEGRSHIEAMPFAAPSRRRAHRRAKTGPQSAAARRAVSERMKAYWAKRKAQAVRAAAPNKSAPAKPHQSAAARKAQSARMKEIWAKRKAEAAKKAK